MLNYVMRTFFFLIDNCPHPPPLSNFSYNFAGTVGFYGEAGGTRLCHYCLFEDDKVAATAGCFQQLCTIYKFEMMGSLVYNTNICYTPAIDDHTHIDSHFRMPFNAISRRRITIMHV